MAVLGAKTKFQMEDPDSADTYFTVPGIRTYGETGETRQQVDVTSIDDEDPVFIAGDKETNQKDITGTLKPSDANQKKFRDAAKEGKTIKCKVVYRDGSERKFSLALLGYKENEIARNESVTFTVPSVRTGAIEYTEAS